MLLLGTTFLLVLCLTVDLTYAAGPERGGWFGFQVPDPEVEPEITFGLGYMEIRGAKMIVTKGYSFGDIKVAYETIDYMIISLTRPLDPSEPINIYSYPHSGVFTWYDEDGDVVGFGTFESEGGDKPPYGGSLWFGGSGIEVKGKYRVLKWIDLYVEYPTGYWWTIKYPVLLGHAGTWQTIA